MKRVLAFVVAFMMLIISVACSPAAAPENILPHATGHIYLYGEQHGIERILKEEFELWHGYYHEEGMRHLFDESPYYTAEFLNIWMQSDNDDILDALYADLAGALSQNPYTKEFYQKIKRECPETVFHGTDVGHQHQSTGKRYLQYLKDNGQKDSAQYALAQEAIAQGKRYYRKNDHAYRENMMAENFIQEFDALVDADVMGIYGSAHTQLDAMDFTTQSVPNMATQLKEVYGDALYSEDLSIIRVDTIKIGEKEYRATYYGTWDLSWLEGYLHREFWRLEDAYDDYKDCPKTGEVLPYDQYPMVIDTGEVYVIDYTKTDKTVERKYYRSDGNLWENLPTTEAFLLE